MTFKNLSLLLGAVMLCAFSLIAQSSQGPTLIPQINRDLFVGQVNGFYPTIQSAVTATCAIFERARISGISCDCFGRQPGRWNERIYDLRSHGMRQSADHRSARAAGNHLLLGRECLFLLWRWWRRRYHCAYLRLRGFWNGFSVYTLHQDEWGSLRAIGYD
jgi:hypothetical protein